jgi:hypothetical protein
MWLSRNDVVFDNVSFQSYAGDLPWDVLDLALDIVTEGGTSPTNNLEVSYA